MGSKFRTFAWVASGIIGLANTDAGVRSADAIQCDGAYLSKILKGGADLGLEQSLALCRYLRLSTDETDFFLLPVQFKRAGTEHLRRHFLLKIHDVEQSRIQLKNRFRVGVGLSAEDTFTYFSEWYFPVIHLILVTMKGFRNARDIERALGLSTDVVLKAIEFLEKIGLIQRDEDHYKQGKRNIHLSNDSPVITSYHAQWRLQAIRSLERKAELDLHYSNTVTINKKDFETIRKILVSAIESVRDQVSASKDENVVSAFTLDWFEI